MTDDVSLDMSLFMIFHVISRAKALKGTTKYANSQLTFVKWNIHGSDKHFPPLVIKYAYV